jgi:hypothetical protein
VEIDWLFPRPTGREFDTETFMINRPFPGNRMRPGFATAFRYWMTGILIALVGGSTLAADQLTEGSSSKKFRNQTVQSIPFHQINDETKNKISEILKKPSIYRRLPVTSINADPDYFQFLVRYPEVIVNIWQLMGVTQMSTERTGPYTVLSNDGAGTISSLELVYGTENLHIFYGTGTYEGPILRRKLTGKCVLVLRSENKPGASGKPVSTSQLDVFLKVENATANLIARTIQPLVGTTADHNFVESLKFVQRLNETTEKNGPGVQQMGKKLKIDDNVRQEFNKVVDIVFQRAINASAPGPAGRPAYETKYSAPAQPPRNLNSQYLKQNYQTPTRSAPSYQSRQDVGQYPVRQPMQNGYGLPPRGYQPPRYAAPVSGYGFQPDYGRPVQAGYNGFGQTPAAVGGIERAGWQPSR